MSAADAAAGMVPAAADWLRRPRENRCPLALRNRGITTFVHLDRYMHLRCLSGRRLGSAIVRD